ncbi:hypothetical protein Barb4_01623 [Bacteroidales bacterium Barb4]|nr:hypothetical protein Barb4_01623 [Bacteroidales bacterium Barb4]
MEFNVFFLAIPFLAVAYYVVPERFIQKKHDYVKFILTFLSLFFLVFIVVTNLLNNRAATHMLEGVTFVPALFIYHLLFPFKTVKRNQHLTFFLFFLTLFEGILGAALLCVPLFSKM